MQSIYHFTFCICIFIYVHLYSYLFRYVYIYLLLFIIMLVSYWAKAMSFLPSPMDHKLHLNLARMRLSRYATQSLRSGPRTSVERASSERSPWRRGSTRELASGRPARPGRSPPWVWRWALPSTSRRSKLWSGGYLGFLTRTQVAGTARDLH